MAESTQRPDETGPASNPEQECAECRRTCPSTELLKYGELLLCVRCKQAVVEKLERGQRIGQGQWRDGNLVVVEAGNALPDRCVKCNAPSAESYRKNFSWITPWASLGILVAILLPSSFLVLVVLAIVLQKKGKITFHLCGTHSKTWKRIATVATVMGGVGILAVGGAISLNAQPGADGTGDMVLGIGFLLISGALGLAVYRSSLFRAKKIKAGTLYIKGAGEEFLDALPHWHGLKSE